MSPRGSSPNGWRPAARGRRRSGFTLFELLMVLGIIALVGGLSAGAFQIARRSYALSASASRVEGTLRAARNAAVSSGVGSRVAIETEPPRAVAYGFEALGEWGFEEEENGVVHGARRAPAVLTGGASLGKGCAGKGLHLEMGGYADCGNQSVYDLRAGVFAEAWVRWRPPEGPASAGSSRPGRKGGVASGGKRTPAPARPPPRPEKSTSPARRSFTRSAGIDKAAREKAEPEMRRLRSSNEVIPIDDASAVLGKGGAYFLGIGRDGSLEGRIGSYRVRTWSGAVLPERWTRIALSFDGEEVLLLADGIERDAVLLDRPAGEKETPPPPPAIPPSGEPLRIGSPSSPGPLDIDEVRLYGMVEPLVYELGGRERFLGWKKVIRFDRHGRLDPRFHEVGVRFILYEEEDPSVSFRTEVAVDRTVTYAEWARRRGLAVEEGAEDAEEAKLLAKIAGARRVAIAVDPSGALR